MPEITTAQQRQQATATRVPRPVWLATALGMAGTAAFDAVTPLGYASSLPYVLIVLLGLWTDSRRFVAGVAVAGSLMTVIGVYLSPPSESGSLYLANRAVTLFAIALCALLVMYQLKLRREVQASLKREVGTLLVAGVMLLGLDTKARITLLNPKGHELLRTGGADVRGKDWIAEFLPPEVRKDVREMFDGAMAGKVEMPAQFQNEVLTFDGRRRMFNWQNLLLRDSTGAVSGVLSSGEDVTDIQDAETELKSRRQQLVQARHDLVSAEQMMAAIVENAVEGIITINEQGIVQSANKAAQRIFGYEQPELIGRNVSMLMPSPDREQHDGYLRKYIDTGVAGIIGKGREVVAVRKDGTRVPIYLSVSDVRQGAGVFTGIVRDLTEQKRLQAKLIEQEALATLGRMAAVVAHEVKNPMAGISGVIQIVQQRLGPGHEFQPVLNEVLERIDALVETLQDILLYARPRELRVERVKIAELLRETARLVNNDARASAVRIEIPDSDCDLDLDVAYMREALLNVLLNAAQAMGGKGTIRTETEVQQGKCCVRISDSGPGMPPEVLARAFEPFFTTKGRGTGLGLSLVRSVVERHGGDVQIQCPATGGTVVSLRLPRATPAAG